MKHSLPTDLAFPINIVVTDTQRADGRVYVDDPVIVNNVDEFTLWVKNERDSYLEHEHQKNFVEFIWLLASFVDENPSSVLRSYYGLATYEMTHVVS